VHALTGGFFWLAAWLMTTGLALAGVVVLAGLLRAMHSGYRDDQIHLLDIWNWVWHHPSQAAKRVKNKRTDGA